MNWHCRRQFQSLFRHSAGVVPVACMAAALLLAPCVRWVDDRTRWTLLGFGPEGAKALLAGLSASLLTFIVFAFSILLLAVQYASGQLTSRIIARAFESPATKMTLGAFVFSFSFSMAALGRIEGRVPQLPVALTLLLSLSSVALFLYLIQTVRLGFRPITILTRVAGDTRTVIDALYPRPYSTAGAILPSLGLARRTIKHQGPPGVLLDFDAAGLTAIATRAAYTIEMVPEAGDFLAKEDDLFCLYGAGAEAVEEGSLRRSIELGPERVLRRDPAFGFRIIVDIAIRALSPGINDPTTAVLAVDQLHHLLRLLGQRQFDRPCNGQLGLRAPLPMLR
jgi:uncharacterized membrane protein